MMKTRLLAFCFFSLIQIYSAAALFSQTSRLDSLHQVLVLAKNDTQRINTLNQLAWQWRRTNLDSAIPYGTRAILLSEKLVDSNMIVINDEQVRVRLSRLKSRKLADSYYQMGVFIGSKNDFRGALGYFIRALVLSEKTSNAAFYSKILTDIGYTYSMLNDIPKALYYNLQALRIADSLKNHPSLITLSNRIGMIYIDKSDFQKAFECFTRCFNLAQQDKDSISIMFSLNNIGLAYWNQGNLLKALDNYFNALKIADQLNNTSQAAITLSNIGLIYWSQKNYSQAFDYMFKALGLEEKIGDKLQIARNLSNISDLYNDLGDYVNTINYNSWALELREELHDKRGLALSYSVFADVYTRQGDSAWAKKNTDYARESRYPLALTYFEKALNLVKQLGDLNYEAIYKANIGHLLTRMGNYEEAEQNLSRSLQISDSIGSLNQQEISHQYLSELYEETGAYRKAYEHHKLYSILKDSIYNKDKSMESNRKFLSYEYDKKTALLRAEQNKKDALNSSEKKRERVVIYSISAVLLLVLCLAIIIYRSNRQKQKTNKQLERKNNTIEIQKKVVEDKNRHITESINYAKRIQEAILPSSLFKPEEIREHFVYHLPKDIVSGDFYWRFKDGDDLFFAVVDCTGHGVPGAMMSMLGYDMLEYAVKDKGLRDPGQIIQALNEQMMEKLLKSNPGGSTDGMDLTLCKLNSISQTLTFAGAKNDLIVVTPEKGVELYQVDKCSVGDQPKFCFKQQTIQLQSHQSVFLFTDGYADQKGGPEQKKFMAGRFRELLGEISELPCEEQKLQLQKEFNDWKANATQRDDVLVVGFKL